MRNEGSKSSFSYSSRNSRPQEGDFDELEGFYGSGSLGVKVNTNSRSRGSSGNNTNRDVDFENFEESRDVPIRERKGRAPDTKFDLDSSMEYMRKKTVIIPDVVSKAIDRMSGRWVTQMAGVLARGYKTCSLFGTSRVFDKSERGAIERDEGLVKELNVLIDFLVQTTGLKRSYVNWGNLVQAKRVNEGLKLMYKEMLSSKDREIRKSKGMKVWGNVLSFVECAEAIVKDLNNLSIILNYRVDKVQQDENLLNQILSFYPHHLMILAETVEVRKSGVTSSLASRLTDILNRVSNILDVDFEFEGELYDFFLVDGPLVEINSMLNDALRNFKRKITNVRKTGKIFTPYLIDEHAKGVVKAKKRTDILDWYENPGYTYLNKGNNTKKNEQEISQNKVPVKGGTVSQEDVPFKQEAPRNEPEKTDKDDDSDELDNFSTNTDF